MARLRTVAGLALFALSVCAAFPGQRSSVHGDIVYVPKQMWHLASHGGTQMSTRLAMNGYQDLLHNYQPTEETQGR